MKTNTIHLGDCLDIIRQFPDNCIDTILTDPPYELNFMSKKWDNKGIAFDPEVWRECLRVAKPGAMLMAFGGTRTHHRLMCAIEDAGWEIRDCINYLHDGNFQEAAFMASLNEEQLAAYLELHRPNNTRFWVYGSGFPKSKRITESADRFVLKGDVCQCVGNKNNNENTYPTWDGYGSCGLKPSFEPIVCAMKPVDKNYAHNAEKWGVAGIWVDGGRIEANGESLSGGMINGTSKCSEGWDRPWRHNPGAIERKKREQAERIAAAEAKGRWPANIIHSGEPEVEMEFAKASYVQPCGSPKKTNHTNGMFGIGQPGRIYRDDTNTPSRFFYTAKASPSERGNYNTHPCVKPLSLLKYLCRLTKTPTGGIILDPFAGSGTTALAAIAEGRDFILIEKEPEYVELCKRRIAEYTGQEISEKEIEISEDIIVKQLSLW